MYHPCQRRRIPALSKWHWEEVGMNIRGIGTNETRTDMHMNRHKYFRWTARTTRITFAYMVVFPAFIGYLAYTTDVSNLWRFGLIWVGSWWSKGKVGHEREAEGWYHCRILNVRGLGRDQGHGTQLMSCWKSREAGALYIQDGNSRMQYVKILNRTPLYLCSTFYNLVHS